MGFVPSVPGFPQALPHESLEPDHNDHANNNNDDEGHIGMFDLDED